MFYLYLLRIYLAPEGVSNNPDDKADDDGNHNGGQQSLHAIYLICDFAVSLPHDEVRLEKDEKEEDNKDKNHKPEQTSSGPTIT